MAMANVNNWFLIGIPLAALVYVYGAEFVQVQLEDRPATVAEIQERVSGSPCWSAALTDALASGPILKSMLDDPKRLSHCKVVDHQWQALNPRPRPGGIPVTEQQPGIAGEQNP